MAQKMESIIYQLFVHNWQRKLVALFTAIILWFFVSHSITETKVIRNVPIRISNLPANKTVLGLLPNGILHKRINLTLTGAKDVIEEIEPGDLEVNIDASAIDHADWIVQINKKNLLSLNPSIDLANNISSVTHTEFVIKLNRLVSEKIPVDILPPTGEAPPGYVFLDIWPQRLLQTVSGPEEEINKLKSQGLSLVFDLNAISKQDLDALKSLHQSGLNNEISFAVPYSWKQVTIPFRNFIVEEINDPDAQYIHIDFLREEFLHVERQLPIRVFYPTKKLVDMNPENTPLAKNQDLIHKFSTDLFTHPLFAKNVSYLFLNVIQDYLEITIVADEKNEEDILPWSLGIITPHDLEETYVAYQMSNGVKQVNSLSQKNREQLYRKRFREYLQKMSLYLSKDHKLNIESFIRNDKIEILHY